MHGEIQIVWDDFDGIWRYLFEATTEFGHKIVSSGVSELAEGIDSDMLIYEIKNLCSIDECGEIRKISDVEYKIVL